MGCGSSKVLPGDPAGEAGAADKGAYGDARGMNKELNNTFHVVNLGQFTSDGFASKLQAGAAGGGTAGGTAGGKGGDGTAGTAGKAGKGAAGGADELVTCVTSESAVKVAVTVRPLMDHEKGCSDIVSVLPPNRIHLPKKPAAGKEATKDDVHPFEFDSVIKVDGASSSKQVFGLVLPVIERFCQGFNATVLAYGQTGSGKTYTMGTSSSQKDLTSNEPRGVVPRTLLVLFSYIAVAAEAYDISLKVQYIEIYNEQVVDLLASSSRSSDAVTPLKSSPSGTPPAKSSAVSSRLDIRERPGGEVFVDGATELNVSSREEVARVLDQGNANRSVASHKMNSESSRSHAIVTLVLEQRAKQHMAHNVPEDLRYLRSKLHLVDLAGSERVKDTGATGDRMSEGISINRGLLELGNVINALTEGKKRVHVPYRNSKLTRLLADSLGGNSETLFLACVSPADKNHEQTLNTLRYASRARAIKNNLRQNNKMSAEEEVEYLRALVQQLQQENSELKSQLEGGAGAGAGAGVPGSTATKAKSSEHMVVMDF